jgi:hypothetical protein
MPKGPKGIRGGEQEVKEAKSVKEVKEVMKHRVTKGTDEGRMRAAHRGYPRFL